MKSCTATTANNSAAIAATTLTKEGMTLGAVMRISEAAHKPTSAANTGPLATRSIGSSSENERFAYDKDRKSCCYNVVSSPKVMDREQRSCDNKGDAVQAPKKPTQ
jgi:hypothetical protein